MSNETKPISVLERTHPYDAFPNGIGEIPPAGHVPGVRVFEIPGLKSNEDAMKNLNGGRVKEIRDELTNMGKYVRHDWSAGRIIFFIGATAAVLGGTVGVKVLIDRKREGRKAKESKQEETR